MHERKNGQQVQRLKETPERESLPELLGYDGELNSLPLQRLSATPEKTKHKPSLRQSLEQIYADPNERSKKLLEGLHTSTNQFSELNNQLRSAKSDYLGCKLALDSWYYGPAIADMLYHVFNNSASWATFLEAGVLSGVAMVVTYSIQSDKASFNEGEHTWEIFEERKTKVKELVKELEHQNKVVNAHIKLLQLDQTQEIQRHDPVSEIVDEISDFFEDKEIEEEILKKAQSTKSG